MQITNGSVSRTVKPADYEGRTVTLSFTADPGDDLELTLQHLSFLCEKYARQAPPINVADVTETAQAAEPTKRGRNAKPPVVQTTASVGPTPSAVAPSVAPAPVAASPSAAPTSVAAIPTAEAPAPTAAPSVAPSATAPSVAPASTPASGTAAPSATGPTVTTVASPSEITGQDLNRAIHQALKVWQIDSDLVTGVRDASVSQPGMSIFDDTQEAKQKFLAGLVALDPALVSSGL